MIIFEMVRFWIGFIVFSSSNVARKLFRSREELRAKSGKEIVSDTIVLVYKDVHTEDVFRGRHVTGWSI